MGWASREGGTLLRPTSADRFLDVRVTLLAFEKKNGAVVTYLTAERSEHDGYAP